MLNFKGPKSGFSLLEVVVASALLAGAVLTLCGLSAKSLKHLRLNEEHEHAWEYLNRQMILVELTGVDQMIKNGVKDGSFESDDGRAYTWAMDVQEHEMIENLYDVSMSLQWEDGGKTRAITCDTRMYGIVTEDVVDEDEEEL